MFIALEFSPHAKMKDRRMELQFSEFQQIVRERNESTILALQCAVSVLRRVREITPERRESVVAFVGDLIAIGRGTRPFFKVDQQPNLSSATDPLS